ncbi:peptidase [Leptolyngbya boryana CZ1]|uniref:Peptidase n=1 Tax=Leptolyngbya boryana CZ1 TaxID=3060204 RepID=A0AA97AX84_LEPBY|nr:peptidase [Leptolyngbya boryana]WNZ48985.1 peptidase [Leptolyngbya boryana CZ1]
MARSLKWNWFKAHSICFAIGCVLFWAISVQATPKIHAMPPILAQWSDRSGDYFDRVEKTEPEYLIWSKFPVKVYVQSGDATWAKLITQAVNEWKVYFPLELTEQREEAGIIFDRASIPLRFPPTERVRFADARFELYKQNSILQHRMKIRIQPNRPNASLLLAARHELGHALGIWGHSPLETDVMYFSQVRTPPTISPRDVNTLKRVYEQPTRLGW